MSEPVTGESIPGLEWDSESTPDPILGKSVYIHAFVTDATAYREWIKRHFLNEVDGMRIVGISMDPSFFSFDPKNV